MKTIARRNKFTLKLRYILLLKQTHRWIIIEERAWFLIQTDDEESLKRRKGNVLHIMLEAIKIHKNDIMF